MFKYLTENDFNNYYPVKISQSAEIPQWLRVHLLIEDPNANFIADKTDNLTPLDKGKDWMFELTLKHQPKTGALLLNGSPLSLYCYHRGKGSGRHLVTEVCGKAIVIDRSFVGNNPCDDEYFKTRMRRNRYLSLPVEIREAYYFRFIGLDIPEREVVGIYPRLLTRNIGSAWRSIDRYLEPLKLSKKYLPLLSKLDSSYFHATEKDAWTNFMCFLDTRPTLSGLEGDVFFVKTEIENSPIYHIHNGDVENMRILTNYAEAIDGYCAQVLSANNNQFDFLPYGEKLDWL
jgi:hypothetical protein